MNRFQRMFIGGLSFMMFFTPAQASEIHPVVSIGYDLGGATLLDYTVVQVNDRTVNREDKITAGNGLTLSLGAYVPIFEDIALQGTVGLKVDSTTFVNAYVAFFRNPIDLLAIYHLGKHHSFSGGLTYHTNTAFTFESTAQNETLNFDDAIGVIAEYTYAVHNSRNGGIKLGVRYTNIDYTLTGTTTIANGSSVGLILYAY